MKITDSRLPCPEGEGDNRFKKQLVDPSMKTLYVWDFIRRLGNAGSHAVLSEDNKRWLEEKYIIVALEQLCFRMGSYFYGKNNRDIKVKYSLEKNSLASRVVFYPQENGKTISVERQGILPGYVEKKYYTVMPKSNSQGGKIYWENYINKYSIIRRYEIISGDGVRDYLLQSQKAYLILQQTGNLEGVASYAVLADLRNSADYYVTSYEFDIEPLDLCVEVLQECGIYDSGKKLLLLQLRFIKIMMNLNANHIYHRNLTHNSVKICKLSDAEFELKIIDFELVKLYEQENEILPQETVYKFINEQTLLMNKSVMEPAKYDPYGNIRQYGAVEWNADTTELEYQREQVRRAGMILRNILCPAHFDNSKSFNTVASLEEICEQGNICTKNIDDELMKKLFYVSNSLISDTDYSLEQAYDAIEGMINEYYGDWLQRS